MTIADVNVLVYALQTHSVHHQTSRQWLEDEIGSGLPFGVSLLILSAVVRIATNPRMQPAPSTLADAFAFTNRLRSQRNCRLLQPGDRHWPIFERLCLDTSTRGPNVSDAWHAALAIEHDCEWVSFDRDFARFPGLRWRTP